jgi:hypothetical protein
MTETPVRVPARSMPTYLGGVRGGPHRGAEGPSGRARTHLGRGPGVRRLCPRERGYGRAPCPGSARSRAARLLHRGPDRVVRAAPLSTHPSVHRGSPAPRDRAGLERRLHALPVRLAACKRRQPPLRRGGLPAVLERLACFEAPAPAWEVGLLPARLSDYDPDWLDRFCLSGREYGGGASPTRPARAPRPRCAWRRSRSCGLLAHGSGVTD